MSRLGERKLFTQYTVFVSSGDDALTLRDRLEDVVVHAINPILEREGAFTKLYVDRWENTSALRPDGATSNQEFVQRAIKSDHTVALLLDRLRPGTREELEAVLPVKEVELSALWFIPKDGGHPETEVGAFLSDHGNDLIWDRTGDPNSEESWIGVIRVLTTAVVRALSNDERVWSEERNA